MTALGPHPLTAADTLEVDLDDELGDELYQSPHEGRGSVEVVVGESMQTMQVSVETFDEELASIRPHAGAERALSLTSPSTVLMSIPAEMMID